MRARLYITIAIGFALLVSTSGNAQRPTCKLIDGVPAELHSGPREAPSLGVTLKSTWGVEYRWDIMDKEAVGWMRITDEKGQEIGWLPPGHPGIVCGNSP